MERQEVRKIIRCYRRGNGRTFSCCSGPTSRTSPGGARTSQANIHKQKNDRPCDRLSVHPASCPASSGRSESRSWSRRLSCFCSGASVFSALKSCRTPNC